MKIFNTIFFVCVTLWAAILSQSCKTNTDASNPTNESSSSLELFKKYNLDKIRVPQGFKIDVYAEVPNARSMVLSPSGILYVGNRAENSVYAVVDINKDGFADSVYTIVKDMDTPNGVAFKDGALYIATISSIFKINNIEGDLAHPGKPELISDKFPTDKHHGWKYIAFGPDGKLYVPVGDPSNISEQTNKIYSTIMRMNADGSDLEMYARGIRNTVGFDWQPGTNAMWFTDNGRDQLADDIPTDELNYAPAQGMHFGHPYCLQGNILDPKFGVGKNCADYTAPALLLGPHVAALGMRFYTGTMFDSSYRQKVFIAEHGSWNRSTPLGYRISTATIDGTKATKYETFADGWLQADGKVLGRPVDVQVMADGALLVSDDYAGAVYRISKK